MEHFAFDFEDRYQWMLALIGVKPSNSEVTVDDKELRVRFGMWKLRTPLSNIVGFETSGDYSWFKAIGARGSFKDRGVTFGSSTRAGLCVKFADPVPALVAGDMFPHPGMTVTVLDVAGLAAALRRHAIAGEGP
jgi:hypothetical protein